MTATPESRAKEETIVKAKDSPMAELPNTLDNQQAIRNEAIRTLLSKVFHARIGQTR